MLMDLHVHTSFSKGTKIEREGVSTPTELVKRAKEMGLGAIAITDHDNMDGVREALRAGKRYGIIIIPGEEVSTHQGHILALGIRKAIPKDLDYKKTLDIIHEQGGIGIASHPFDTANRGLKKLALECDGVEVFNALNMERISNSKCEKFAKKHKLSAIAGSDAHRTDMLGHGLTRVEARTPKEILEKIKKGKTSIVCKYMPTKIIVSWTVWRLKKSYTYTINYMDRNYSWPKKAAGKKLISLVEKSPGSVDYLFNIMGYIAIGCLVLYRATREIVGL
jgi:hypothetical protein